MRAFHNTTVDGSYTVLVNGFRVQVFCYHMTESQPRTYIDVNEQTNYAEVYNKRLLHPYTCPYNGERNDSCACQVEPVSRSGKTLFQRLRVDLHNMKVNGCHSYRQLITLRALLQYSTRPSRVNFTARRSCTPPQATATAA